MQRTLTSAGGDADVACSMILSEQETMSRMQDNLLSNKANTNQEKFPDLPDACENEVPRKRGAVNLKKRLWRPVHSFEKIHGSNYIKNSTTPIKTNAWSSATDSIQDIQNYTHAPLKIAQNAFYKKSLNPARAIIDIIYHYTQYLLEFSESSSLSSPPREHETTNVKLTNTGGRVQSVRGLAHSKHISAAIPAETKKSKSQGTASSIKQTYVYHPSSDEAMELNSIIGSNPSLKAINPEFLKQALIFFDGDVAQTTLVAVFIMDCDAARFTFIDVGPKVPIVKHHQNLKTCPGTTTAKEKAASSDSTVLDPASFVSDESYDNAVKICEDVFNNYTADLHGFLPHEATLITQTCLKTWWSEELALREINGHRLNQIKAVNVAPFKVITGRGLHSVGGISKVRIKVRSYLESNAYVYLEEPSFFIVQGKRKA